MYHRTLGGGGTRTLGVAADSNQLYLAFIEDYRVTYLTLSTLPALSPLILRLYLWDGYGDYLSFQNKETKTEFCWTLVPE